jgi:hypothetical protein
MGFAGGGFGRWFIAGVWGRCLERISLECEDLGLGWGLNASTVTLFWTLSGGFGSWISDET